MEQNKDYLKKVLDTLMNLIRTTPKDTLKVELSQEYISVEVLIYETIQIFSYRMVFVFKSPSKEEELRMKVIQSIVELNILRFNNNH